MEAELKTVKKIYAAMAIMLALSLVPSTWAAMAVMIFFTAILYIASSIRKKSVPDGFAAIHMTYIVRTIWISSLFAAITGALASIYVLANYDPSSIHDCMDNVIDEGFDARTCLDAFIDANYAIFRNGTVMAGVPVGIYFVYRFVRGFAASFKGKTIERPKAWL